MYWLYVTDSTGNYMKSIQLSHDILHLCYVSMKHCLIDIDTLCGIEGHKKWEDQ